jgi:hypothetical protein
VPRVSIVSRMPLRKNLLNVIGVVILISMCETAWATTLGGPRLSSSDSAPIMPAATVDPTAP